MAAAAAAGGALLGVVVLFGCSASPKLVGQGGECAVSTDCDLGLVCVPQKSGRICTNDVSSIAKATPAPSSDAAADGSADGDLDGAASDAVAAPDVAQPQPDSSMPAPDASQPTPDASPSVDAGGD